MPHVISTAQAQTRIRPVYLPCLACLRWYWSINVLHDSSTVVAVNGKVFNYTRTLLNRKLRATTSGLTGVCNHFFHDYCQRCYPQGSKLQQTMAILRKPWFIYQTANDITDSVFPLSVSLESVIQSDNLCWFCQKQFVEHICCLMNLEMKYKQTE